MGILKVETWGEGQGDFVIIDEESFDENFHVLYKEDSEPIDTESLDIETLKIEAEELGIEFPPKIGAKKLLALIEAKKAE